MRALVISLNQARRDALLEAALEAGTRAEPCDSPEAALDLLDRGYQLIVYDVPRCTAGALRFVRQMGRRELATVLVCPDVSFDEAVEAMRAGACDIVSGRIGTPEVARRIASAARQRRPETAQATPDAAPQAAPPAARPSDRAAEPPTERLVAGTIGRARPLSEARQRDAAAEAPDALVAKLAAQMRHELDVEALLRRCLEFVLAQVGPTNAAVFLPATSGDYSLGAYVNYSIAKDHHELLLDHLANTAAPRLDGLARATLMPTDAAITLRAPEAAPWLEGQGLLAVACRAPSDATGPECLAVLALFRDKATPFSLKCVDLLDRVSPVFAAALARVVRVHNRHLPPDKWGKIGEPYREDPGEAA
ncbi:MAG: hypothetical protein C0475_08160 [Planctomyces sp.]|nr:hypothetical protein [Planctomyces sp.]MBA4119892.1 hypothetical protein [Isosphaera sp.]